MLNLVYFCNLDNYPENKKQKHEKIKKSSKVRKHFTFSIINDWGKTETAFICLLSPYTIFSTWKLEFQGKQAVNMEERWGAYTKNTPDFFVFNFKNFVLCYILVFFLDLNKTLMSHNLTLLIILLKSDWYTWKYITTFTLAQLKSVFS